MAFSFPEPAAASAVDRVVARAVAPCAAVHDVGRRVDAVDDVRAGVAGEQILAAHVVDGVVAGPTEQRVVRAVSGEGVVALATGEELHVAGNRVLLTGLAVVGLFVEREADRRGARRVIHEVSAAFAGQGVSTPGADEQIVARAAA